MIDTVHFTLNGKPVHLEGDRDRILLWVLRTDLEQTGTKFGCGEGYCGACTVLVDGKAINSCLMLAVEAQGKEILTIEGLSEGGDLHPIQETFVTHGAVQCGFCSPGLIMGSRAFLAENPKPSDKEIKKALSGHLCRCTGYVQIIEAVSAAAEKMGSS